MTEAERGQERRRRPARRELRAHPVGRLLVEPVVDQEGLGKPPTRRERREVEGRERATALLLHRRLEPVARALGEADGGAELVRPLAEVRRGTDEHESRRVESVVDDERGDRAPEGVGDHAGGLAVL